MIASGLLLLLSLSPTLALDVVDSTAAADDHDRPPFFLYPREVEHWATLDTYEPDFLAFDRSIMGRAVDDITNLTNNLPILTNIEQGETRNFVFTNHSLWGPKSTQEFKLPSAGRLRGRQEDSLLSDENLRSRAESLRTIYITINTCLQPSSNTTAGPPPQLELYVSTSDENQRPGPSVSSSQKVTLDGGAGSVTLNINGNVYVGVHAPNTTGFTGIYNAEVAASIDAPYHTYNSSSSNLLVVDADYGAALLVTQNLTQSMYNTSLWKEWMALRPPFVAFAFDQRESAILGVQNSFCGLTQYTQVSSAKGNVQSSMTDRGIGRQPKQQFYISGLNSSATYYGIMALPPDNATTAAVGGGGTVWQTKNFSTISDSNCQIIYDLAFCDQIAYAVPSNAKTFPNRTALAAFYDNSTQAAYQFFDYTLQQVPCNITSSGQYSLARTCAHCAAAYKQWLCAVSLPRCTHFSSPKTWLQARNIMQAFPNGTSLVNAYRDPRARVRYLNASRNPAIDALVQPGPYKEVLPCADLCYNLVQSCPASLGFACPQPGMGGFNQSYGYMPSAAEKGQMTCNYPGIVALGRGARSRGAGSVWTLLLLVAAIFL